MSYEAKSISFTDSAFAAGDEDPADELGEPEAEVEDDAPTLR
jgi:hypothetical protein